MYDDNFSLIDLRRLFPPPMWPDDSEFAVDYELTTAVTELHGYRKSEVATLWQSIEDVLEAYAAARRYIRGSYRTGTESIGASSNVVTFDRHVR